jgi:hypothetical protein
MSKVRLQENDRGSYSVVPTCRRKIGYRSANMASLECQRLQKANPSGHFSVYRCNDCLDWHVGHSIGQMGRTPVNPDAPPERDGEYEALVQRQHQIQGALTDLKVSRPWDWEHKRRYLTGELAATVSRMQEIKMHRRRIAEKEHQASQWTHEQKAAWHAQRAKEEAE